MQRSALTVVLLAGVLIGCGSGGGESSQAVGIDGTVAASAEPDTTQSGISPAVGTPPTVAPIVGEHSFPSYLDLQQGVNQTLSSSSEDVFVWPGRDGSSVTFNTRSREVTIRGEAFDSTRGAVADSFVPLSDETMALIRSGESFVDRDAVKWVLASGEGREFRRTIDYSPDTGVTLRLSVGDLGAALFRLCGECAMDNGDLLFDTFDGSRALGVGLLPPGTSGASAAEGDLQLLFDPVLGRTFYVMLVGRDSGDVQLDLTLDSSLGGGATGARGARTLTLPIVRSASSN